MKRYAAALGLFGFLAAIVLALPGDAPFGSVLRSAFLWGITFGVVGLFLGRAAAVLLHEGGIPNGGAVATESELAEEPTTIESREAERGPEDSEDPSRDASEEGSAETQKSAGEVENNR